MSGDNIKDIRDRGRGGLASGIICWEQFGTFYGVLGKKCLLHYICYKKTTKVPRFIFSVWRDDVHSIIIISGVMISADEREFSANCFDKERVELIRSLKVSIRLFPNVMGHLSTLNSSQLQEILRTELSEDSLESSSGVSLGELSPMSSHRCLMKTWPLIWNWNIFVLLKFSSNPNKRTIRSRLFVQYLIGGVTLQIWPLLMSAMWGGTRRAWPTTTSCWPTATWWRTGRGPSSMSPPLIRWVRWVIRF